MPVRAVTFNFKPEISVERQDQVLKVITRWSSVEKVARLKPGTKVPLLQRMAHLYVAEDANPEEVVQRLREIPEVESAGLPPTRGLIR